MLQMIGSSIYHTFMLWRFLIIRGQHWRLKLLKLLLRGKNLLNICFLLHIRIRWCLLWGGSSNLRINNYSGWFFIFKLMRSINAFFLRRLFDKGRINISRSDFMRSRSEFDFFYQSNWLTNPRFKICRHHYRVSISPITFSQFGIRYKIICTFSLLYV